MMQNPKQPPESVRKAGRALISDEDFDACLAGEGDRTRFLLGDRPMNMLPPLLTLLGRNQEVAVLPILSRLPDEVADRRALLYRMGETFAMFPATFDVVAAFFAFETWMKELTPAEAHRNDGRGAASYADRVDSAVIMGETLDGRQNLVVFECERNAEQQLSGLKELKRQKCEHLSDPESVLHQFFVGYVVGVAQRGSARDIRS